MNGDELMYIKVVPCLCERMTNWNVVGIFTAVDMSENRTGNAPPVLGPEIYSPWRASRLGCITESLEENLLLELVGDPKGLDVLDVGCGDGDLAFSLAESGACVVGVDPSEGMIDKAREMAELRNSTATFQCDEGESLSFDEARFDLVLAKTILCFVDDAPMVFSEMARVLRPNGRLVIGELGRWSFWALQRYIRGRFGSRLWRRGNSWTSAQLRTMAEDAGFTVTEIRGSVFYPRWAFAARVMSRFDEPLGRMTTFGAAFIAMAATKDGFAS